MPVTVSLKDLVAVRGTRPLWPDQFEGLVATLEENPAELTQWLIVADWCKDNDEPELEAGFRFVGKRPSVAVERARTSKSGAAWWLANLPAALNAQYPPGPSDDSTLAGVAAHLAEKIRMARAELE
jgi:uncharacterized protein (TIGR02996 family)